MPERILKYGLWFDPWMNPLEIEFEMIRHGGRFMADGVEYGEGLFQHYKNAQTLIWPDEDHHRWSDLILKTIMEERLTVVQGCRDSGKTRGVSKFVLVDYFCFPFDTLTLMSSTDVRGLELRVWGDLKDLWDRALARFDWLAGNPVDSKHGIFTDALDDDNNLRDMRRGIICVPVLDSEGNETKTLERFVGVKQKRRRLVADETQFLNPRYLNVLSNLDKGEFKAVFTGNPLGQQALDKVAEPECGWDNMSEPTKTMTWRNKFDGVTINLVGTDSPNFDTDRPKTYSYMIDPVDAERVKKRFGPDSIEFYSQIKGVRKAGMNMRLVLTPEMCRINGAYDDAVWAGTEITNVLGVDAGYGGDACETMFIQFGEGSNRKTIVKFHDPEIIPINLNSDMSPEDQIAMGVREKCEGLRVPPGNVAFEAGMRATLAVSFGRIFSGQAEAINAGGSATDRPVSDDLLVDDDEKSVGQKRLKRCNEHYSKFITEMWFSVRALVEARMVREIPKGVVKEFSEREWIWARGTRYELESKEDFKKRWNYSPNKADATAIAVEKARRLGLVISRHSDSIKPIEPDDWLEKEVNLHRDFMKKRELV